MYEFYRQVARISAGFFVVAMTSLIGITGFVTWSTVNLKGAELLFGFPLLLSF